MTLDTPALQTENLGYKSGSRWLIKGVALDLKPGFTALIGPNGAGKSTLLRIMAGLLKARRGRIRVGGFTQRSGGQAIGYIPQFPGAYDNLSVREYLLRSAWWDRPEPADTLSQKCEQVMERFHLLDVAQSPGRRLSASERRRVALASVWMRHVQVVLLDEPTADLDPTERLAFWQELYRLRALADSPQSFLVTTHLLSEVQDFCDAVVLLHHGRMRWQGGTAAFIDTAAGHTFFAAEPFDPRTVIDTGRSSARGTWVLSANAQPDFAARPPDLIDAYLWMLHRPTTEDA